MNKTKTSAKSTRRSGRRKNALDASLSILVVVSILLVIRGIDIYRKTIVDPSYIIVVVLVGSILAAFILLVIAKRLLHIVWLLIIAAAIGGGGCYFLVLFLNRELADGEVTSEVFSIKKTGNLGKREKTGCQVPYIIIDFNGRRKQLIFPCEFEHNIQDYIMARIDYSRGLFGFPIVREQELIP